MDVRIGPLAWLDLLDFGRAFASGDREDVEVWIWTHSARTRRRERQTLAGLALLVGTRTAGGRVADAWRPAIGEGTSREGVLAARLVTAYLNDDAPIFDALIETWTTWDDVARAEVFRQLVRS